MRASVKKFDAHRHFWWVFGAAMAALMATTAALSSARADENVIQPDVCRTAGYVLYFDGGKAVDYARIGKKRISAPVCSDAQLRAYWRFVREDADRQETAALEAKFAKIEALWKRIEAAELPKEGGK